jgi:hypothetical protein
MTYFSVKVIENFHKEIFWEGQGVNCGGGVEVAGLFHELIRPGERGHGFKKKKALGLFGGFDWKQRFLFQKFPPLLN